MLDLLLVAVKPEYQNKGINALLFSDLIPVYQQLGFPLHLQNLLRDRGAEGEITHV